jgi:excisionase family DNA binding protein
MSNAVIDRHTEIENLPELLTPQEVRAVFGLGHNTIYSLIESGEIPSRRLGRRLFVPKAELLRFIRGEQ